MKAGPPGSVLFLNHNVRGEGTYLRCHNLAASLSELGIAVDLVCTNPRRGRLCVEEQRERNNLRVILLPEFNPTPSYAGCALRAFLAAERVARRGRKYDVIHAFAVAIPSTALPAFLAGRTRPGRLFLDWDDLWGGGLGRHLPRTANWLLNRLERGIPAAAKPLGLTTASRSLRQKFLEAGFPEASILWLPNGADRELPAVPPKKVCRDNLGIEAEGEILIAMGRMFDESLALLLEAFALVLRRRPAARLFVVGDLCTYGDLGAIVARARRRWRKLGRRVVFTGGKQDRELALWLGAADLLVLPLCNVASDQARFPMRFGSYLVSGRPTVASAAGEVGRISRETGCALTTEAGNPADLARGCLEVLADPDLAARLAEKARETAATRLNWETLGSNLLDFYLVRRQAYLNGKNSSAGKEKQYTRARSPRRN